MCPGSECGHTDEEPAHLEWEGTRSQSERARSDWEPVKTKTSFILYTEAETTDFAEGHV